MTREGALQACIHRLNYERAQLRSLSFWELKKRKVHKYTINCCKEDIIELLQLYKKDEDISWGWKATLEIHGII